MKKICLLLAVVMCLSFLACDSEEPSQPNTAPPSEEARVNDPLFGEEAMEHLDYMYVMGITLSQQISQYAEQENLSDDAAEYAWNCINFRDERREQLLVKLRAIGFDPAEAPEGAHEGSIYGGTALCLVYQDGNRAEVYAFGGSYLRVQLFDENEVLLETTYYKAINMEPDEQIGTKLGDILCEAAWEGVR